MTCAPPPRRRFAVLADPDPGWTAQGDRLIGRLRFAARGRIIRVDHIGFTSVPGHARRAGFVHVPDYWFGKDRQGVRYPEEVLVDADPGGARPG